MWRHVVNTLMWIISQQQHVPKVCYSSYITAICYVQHIVLFISDCNKALTLETPFKNVK